MIPLTFGAIDKMVSSLGENSQLRPVLKILATKSVSLNGPERFRLCIYDGEKMNDWCMLNTQKNSLVQGRPPGHLVVRVLHFTHTALQSGRKVLAIMDMEVLGVEQPAPGVPTFSFSQTAEVSKTEVAPVSVLQSSASFPPSRASYPPSNNTNGNQQLSVTPPRRTASGDSSMLSSPNGINPKRIFPVISLNPYQNRWTIRARCSQKTPIRTWSNSRGEGKLFSFTLTDTSGDIRVTAFGDEVDKYMDMVQVNKVYYLARGSLKASNSQFNTTNNPFEITLHRDSELMECVVEEGSEVAQELATIPVTHYQFIPLSQVEHEPVNNCVDILGVVHQCGEIQDVQARNSSRLMRKRDLYLVDESRTLLRFTLWNEEAEKFQEHAHSHPIVAVKAARVGDFGGRTLSTSMSSCVKVNPDLSQVHQLRQWYATQGSDAAFQGLPTRLSAGGGGMASLSNPSSWRTLAQLKAPMESADPTAAEYFWCKALVAHVKKDNWMYAACPNEGCNKKMVQLSNGFYRCEKCSREITYFKWRLLLQLSLSDMTDNYWVTCFHEQAEQILGRKAEEMGRMKEMQRDLELDQVISDAHLNSYIFRLRAKMENFNDENRLKVTVVDVQPVNFSLYCDILLAQIHDVLANLAN